MMKTVFFVPTTHHDFGYTHYIDDLLELYCQYYDSILDFCDATADYPFEAQYRYTVEEFWSLDYYLKHTTEQNRRRMKSYVAEGRIEISALYANLIDGICSREEIARALYPSARFAEECGVTLKSAALTDMPGMSDGTIAALSSAGIRYLFAGFPTYFRWFDCTGKVPELRHGYWDEKAVNPWGHPSAFRWRSLSGGEVLVWYQDGYGHFGDDYETLYALDAYEDLDPRLEKYLRELEEKGAPYSVMRYIVNGLDNEKPDRKICDFVRKWNGLHDDIKLVVGTNSMFFEALEADTRGLQLPAVTGELPHTDYAVLSLTDASVTALNTRTKARALTLEKFAALNPPNQADDPAVFGDIYRGIHLYDEHCFGMAYPFGYPNEYNRLMKIKHAYRAAMLCDRLYARISPEQKENTWSVFSPIAGDGIAGTVTADRMPAVSDGRDLLIQCDEIDSPLLPVEGATDALAMLPPGRKLYEYTAAARAESLGVSSHTVKEIVDPACVGKPEDWPLENGFYRISFDGSGKTELYDRELKRPITDGSVPAGCVVFRDIRTDEVSFQKVKSVRRRKRGIVASSIVIEAECAGAPQITAEITLYHTIKRIDFSYRILLDRTPLREMYIVFPFGASSPEFSYGGTDCEVRAFDDIVKGGCTNHYAADKYAAVSGGDGRIVLGFAEPHIVLFGGLHPTAVSQAHHYLNPRGFEDPFIGKEDIKNAHIASMIAYNNCRTNFAGSQTGELFCRYSVTSGPDVCAERFAEQFVEEPLLFKGYLPDRALSTGADNILPVCFKRAEDGNGVILRLRECMNRDSVAHIALNGETIPEAWICDLTEKPLSRCDPGAVRIGANQTATVRLLPKSE